MQTLVRVGRFVRRHHLKFHLGAGAIAAAIGAAFLLGVFAGPAALKTVYGQKLDKTGVKIYHAVVARHTEKGERTGTETLPAAQAAKVAAINDQVAAGVTHPHPLATPQPSTSTSLVRNYSARQAGAHPVLLVAHDTESPNAAGTADLKAIAAWFNNPASQASSNYTTDADGNTLLMVPDAKKAWTQAFFNSWAISDEMIGYATEKTWPDAQLRAVAEIFASEAHKWGIPVQVGAVSGCTIVRPGIVDHAMLGACGGGHHDNGPDFPLAHFVALVHAYEVGGYKPTAPAPKPKPVTPAIAPSVLRAKTGYWSWLGWRLGEAAWKGYGKANPTVRPHVAKTVPRSWWTLAAAHVGAHA